MPQSSLVIALVEDALHKQFLFRYLRKLRYEPHQMRVIESPSGRGSAEQWIRDRFAIEVEECRRRSAQTKLIVLIDADKYTVRQRNAQLDQALLGAGIRIEKDSRQTVRLIPKRNMETWILCLNDEQVNEDTDYKRTRNQWTGLVRKAIATLYDWTRPKTAVPPSCVASLRIGVLELQKLEG